MNTTENDIIFADPGYINSIQIIYESGEVFTVFEDRKLNNNMYLCGALGNSQSDTAMVFNRLIDTQAVRLIRLNGIEYLPEK
ncbi:MAG: hypothetical protein IJC48_11325 [Clostridia bacterium]|nr:hypothetical protein [Clostridia bacterium]MBQ4157529.1 hypothetical protein [Clostridia bacterium]